MELVYLWVEEYKNIQKQGFNFSPRFECKFHDEYDEDGKLKDDCKLEIKPKEHIENFFGENINVTAIVGKNGSGKSTLIEIIREFHFTGILLYRLDNKFYFEANNDYKIKSNIIIEKMTLNRQNIFTMNFYNKYEVLENISSAKTIKLYSKYTVKNYFKIHKVLNKNISDINIPSFLSPQYVHIDFDEEYFKINANNVELYARNNRIFRKFYHIEGKGVLNNVRRYVIFLLSTLFIEYKYKYDYKDYKYMKSALYDEWDIDSIKYIENLIKDINNKFDFSIDEYLEIIDSELLGFKKQLNLQYISLQEIEESNLDKLIFKYINFFDFDFSDKNGLRSYEDLSSGEKTLFSYFINLFYILHKCEDNYVTVLIDEPDYTLHPQWQKEFIQLLISFLRINFSEKYISIIVTTHSPFLLSDIPKQNIIFLDKDEKGNCTVVDGLKEKKQTFGANIHTLLSDSFFMEDGLMGEFAKAKIDKAITLLNKDKLDEKELKYCEQIISIIGEPIVRNQLQRMLTNKKISYLAKDTREEIEFLKHRIDLLSKRL